MEVQQPYPFSARPFDGGSETEATISSEGISHVIG